MTTILVADDHPIVLEGLAALFESSEFSVVARCTTGDEVMQALERERPEILLLDVNMPAPGGLEIARRMKQGDTVQKVVLLTSSIDDAQILEAMQLGIEGLILKESAPRQLIQCVAAVGLGDRWIDPEIAQRAVNAALRTRLSPPDSKAQLTARELQVTRLVARGLRNKEIGRELSITEGTVKMYLHSIYEKLEIGNRIELTNVARERGLL